MAEECVEMYGMTGTFFTTDKAYVIPYPIERDFHPFPEMFSDPESDGDDGDYEDAVAPATSAEEESLQGATPLEPSPPVQPAAEVDKATKSLIAKMRENACEVRRKKTELQELNLTKLWSCDLTSC
jgi:hypothetical protein